MTISRHPAPVVEQEDGTLKVQNVGCDQLKEYNVEHKDFLTHLNAYKGKWFWDNIHISD